MMNHLPSETIAEECMREIGVPNLSFVPLFALVSSLFLFACDDPVSPTRIDGIAEAQFGQLRGELRLPVGEQCHTFTAIEDGSEDPVFSVDIEQARVRDF